MVVLGRAGAPQGHVRRHVALIATISIWPLYPEPMTSESKKALDQAQLVQAIGHIVVACGHLEMQLRRALVWLRGLPPGSIAPVRRLGWSVMIDEIRHPHGDMIMHGGDVRTPA